MRTRDIKEGRRLKAPVLLAAYGPRRLYQTTVPARDGYTHLAGGSFFPGGFGFLEDTETGEKFEEEPIATVLKMMPYEWHWYRYPIEEGDSDGFDPTS
jgi:hypothetical protein